MLSDCRQVWRSVAAAPWLSAVIVLSMAAGIGVNAAVFSWIEAVVLHPLPRVADSGRLLFVEAVTANGTMPGASWLEYDELTEGVPALDLLAFRMTPLTLGQGSRARRVYGLVTSEDYFTTLGLEPAAGRFYSGRTSEPGVVISHAMWQTQYGGRADAIGALLRVNGRDLPIEGVAPEGFLGTVLALEFTVWLPRDAVRVLTPGSRDLDDRGSRGLTVMGRLSRGATLASARAQAQSAMRRLQELHKETNESVTVELRTFWQAPRGPQQVFAAALGILQSVLLVVLLAVCGNTANLLLARAGTRQHECAVRLMLGASRWRIARMLLTESLALALAGAALGAVVAVWGSTALRATPPLGGLPVHFDTPIDGLTVAFAAFLGTVCGLLFGVAPAWHLARHGASLTTRAARHAVRRTLLRDLLMAGEVALAVIVLTTAAVFLQRFGETRDQDPGFHRDDVVLAQYDLSGASPSRNESRQFAARLLEGLRGLPVAAASIASAVPLDIHGLPTRGFVLEGRPRPDGAGDEALCNLVTPGYFATLGVPLVSGHDFAPLDDQTSPAQVIVNEAFVSRYLDGREPIGRRLTGRGRDHVIAGVVKTTVSDAFGEPPTPVIYYSYRDWPSAAGQVHVRTRPGGEHVERDIERLVHEIGPDVPVFDVRTMAEHIEKNLLLRRIPARIFAVLGPLLLILALSGIYAVVSHAVAQRTAEMGIRMALGATASRLTGSVVRETLAVIALGVAAGAALSASAGSLLARGATDWLPFVLIPAALLAVAAVACWLPARRVSRIDPLAALRYE